MWLPSELVAFAQVVELGSFTAAARAVGVPKVAVSRAVQSLEKRVGTRLLTRTTRRVSLTDAGRALLPRAQRIAVETAGARREMMPLEDGRRNLRVLADPAYGRLLLAPLLPRFMERFPDIPLEIEMALAVPDEPGEHWDVLFQNGPPLREGLVGTPLGRPPVILCATPAYLKAHPAVTRPDDLAQHAVLVPGPLVSELRLHRGRTQAQVSLTPRLVVTDPSVVHAATAAGAGIGVLPEFLCRIGLSMNKLERVLPEWQVADLLELHAVSDLRRASAPGVKALIEFFIANMVPVLGRG
jgi:LysR family transcriptional regulator, regulator for bpeEF and oprC